MKMLVFLIISFMSTFYFPACNSDKSVTNNNKTTVVGSGDVVSRTVDLPVFHSITNVAIVNITVTKGTPQQVIFTAQQNILDVMTFEVKDGVLTLGFQENINISTDKGIRAEITMTEINRMISDGIGNFDLSGGKQNVLNVDVLGIGNVMAYNLEIDTCQVRITGMGNAYVRVNNLLEVTITGSGNVFYKGNPTINFTITGTGSVVDDN